MEPLEDYVKRVVEEKHCFGGPVWEPKLSSYRPCFPYNPTQRRFVLDPSYTRLAIENDDFPMAALAYHVDALSALAPAVGSLQTVNLPMMTPVPNGVGSCVALNGGVHTAASAHIAGVGAAATFVDFEFDRQLRRPFSERHLISGAVRLLERTVDPVDVVLYTTSKFRTPVNIDCTQPVPDNLQAGDFVALMGYPCYPTEEALGSLYDAMAPGEKPPVRLSASDACEILQPNRKVVSAGVIRDVTANKRHCSVNATAFHGMSGGAAFLLRQHGAPQFIGIVERSGGIYNANIITLAGPHWNP